MSDYCKNCYELTEELENHKRWLNDYKQKLQDAKEFANAKITQCANLIKQLNETHEQLDQLKAESERLKKGIFKLDKTQPQVILTEGQVSLMYCTFLDMELKTTKLKQTLQEIKEIATNHQFPVCEHDGFWILQGVKKRVLQKISEVEDGTSN